MFSAGLLLGYGGRNFRLLGIEGHPLPAIFVKAPGATCWWIRNGPGLRQVLVGVFHGYWSVEVVVGRAVLHDISKPYPTRAHALVGVVRLDRRCTDVVHQPA